MLRSRVARGVELLDRKVPGWEKSVNLDELDMAFADLCVLGQVWGGVGDNISYDYATHDLSLFTFFDERRHGFDAYTVRGQRRLTEQWTKVIKARTERRLVVVAPVTKKVTGEVIVFTGWADEAECVTDEPADLLVGQ